MKKKKAFYCLMAGLLLTACGKQIPEDLIQPDQMEDILYDYHLAVGINYNDNRQRTYRKEAYKRYIFQKHGVTEAEFDSSMVWYTRHTPELSDIYTQIATRLEKEEKHYQRLLAAREQDQRTSVKGDTVELWFRKDMHLFNIGPVADHLTFEFSADENYHQRDSLVWTAHYTFFSKGLANMGLSVKYANDSVVGKDLMITENGEQRISFAPDSINPIKKITGHIKLVQDYSRYSNPRLLVHNLSLMRYKLPVDSLAKTKAVAKPGGPKTEKKEEKLEELHTKRKRKK